jgi:HlyD family secretion protein
LRRAAFLTLLAIALVGLVSALVIQHQIAGAPLVRVVRVVRGHVAQSIPAVTAGRIAPASELTLRSEAAARIASVLIEPGDRVVAGDALFVLDATELERAVLAAESGYEMARASAAEAGLRAQLARNAAKRTRALVSSGSLARIEDENRANEANVLTQAAAAARARVAGQRAELEGAERARDRGIVKAPIAGLVTSISVVVGESVALGAPLVSLADVSRLHVAAQVDESDASRIDLAMPVDLRFEGDDGPPLRSGITRIDPRVSETAQGARVLGFEVSLPENRKWRRGASADVDVITDEREAALVVPISAVVNSGKERQVYVFVEGRAIPRRVELGLGDFGHVEIVRGVHAGESVIDNPEIAGLRGPCDVRVEAARAETQ